MPKRLKILQLCPKPPIPSVDGGCIAMNNITQGLLSMGHDVKVLTVFTHKHDFDEMNFSDSYRSRTEIEGVYVDTRINIVDAFSNMVLRDSYNVSRFFSPDFDKKLIEILQRRNFDIIHIESLFMTPYISTIRRCGNAKIVLRSHNLEYVIWDRMAKGTKSFPKRTYLQYLSKVLKDYEVDIMNHVDGIAAITDYDKSEYEQLGYEKPIANIPFGLDIKKYQPAPQPAEVHLFHLGSMDWFPNVEGITWFLDYVWPLVRRKHPQLKLHLAGRKMPKEFYEKTPPNVVIVGEVDDAQNFMRENGIMIVPILSSGGVRVKIIEGMALGKAIVASPEGAEGINYTAGDNIMIAEKPEDYLEAISQLLEKRSRYENICLNARLFAEENFDNCHIMDTLDRFYQQLLA